MIKDGKPVCLFQNVYRNVGKIWTLVNTPYLILTSNLWLVLPTLCKPSYNKTNK